MAELHFGDHGRKWGCEDPRPGRADDHAERLRSAQLAREIHAEQRLSRDHGVVNTRSWLIDAAAYEPIVTRDAAGRLIVDWGRAADGE